MDFNLTSEQISFQKAAREFAVKELSPYAGTWDEQKKFPKDVIQKAANLGFCGLSVSPDHGGMGCSRLDTSLILEQLAMACPSTAAYISVHNMTTWMVDNYARPAVRKHFVPSLVKGAFLGSYCLTEPGSGSDAAGLKTTAQKKGNQWILNGTKSFVSGAGETDVLVVMARTGTHKTKGISSFVLPSSLKGISYGENEKKLGWNSQPTRIVNLDQVEVPDHYLLGEEGEGFKVAMRGLNGGRVNIASCSVGAAQAAVEHSQKYMHERKQFDQKISQFQALRFKVADMVINVTVSRQMVRLAAARLDQKDLKAPAYCAMAKVFATEKCFDVCNTAIQIFGGYGCTQDYPVERLMRDARIHQIIEGTSEIMRVIVSHTVLDKNESYF